MADIKTILDNTTVTNFGFEKKYTNTGLSYYTNNLKAKKFPYKEDIEDIFRLQGKPRVSAGSSNIVNIYDNAAMRISTITTTSEEGEALQTRNNWIKAYETGIGPKIYFYGYTRPGKKLTIVTDNFDNDLYHFLKDRPIPKDDDEEGKKAIAEEDYQISLQLWPLIENIHSKTKLTCYDIKPQNCVIKKTENSYFLRSGQYNYVVKLIDWDGDWCLDIESENKKHAEQNELENKNLFNETGVRITIKPIQLHNRTHMSLLLMANHFKALNVCQKKPIPNEIFSGDNLIKLGLKDDIKNVEPYMCQDDNLKLMAQHYFNIKDKQICFDDKPENTTTLFEKLYFRIFDEWPRGIKGKENIDCPFFKKQKPKPSTRKAPSIPKKGGRIINTQKRKHKKHRKTNKRISKGKK